MTAENLGEREMENFSGRMEIVKFGLKNRGDGANLQKWNMG